MRQPPPRPPLLRPALTIARYTLLEALRNRLLWLFALAALGALGAAAFAAQLALTEQRALQGALLAALLRLAAAGLLAGFVVSSMAREADDKGQELLLALALPRAVYLFGKLAGFAALALLPALLYGGLGLLVAPPAQAALWGASLLCELWIVAAFSLLCVLGLGQVVPALAACAGFYLLARLIDPLQLLAHQGGAAAAPLQRALAWGIDALALLLPHLARFTRSDWLVYHGGTAAELLAVAAQSAIYLALLAGAALIDLYRKSV
jgi:hypothetical protein